MTEKRFYKVLTDCVVQDILNNELIRGSRIADVMNDLHEENQELIQKINDLRLDVLEGIDKADEIQCTCNPCIVGECVRKVVE